MKILQLSKKFPYPVKDGESLAIANLSKAFAAQGCSVSLLAMNTHKHWVDTHSLPAGLDFYSRIETVTVDNRIKPLQALRNLFCNTSYHIERFIEPRFSEALTAILQKEPFDVVQLETLYLAPYIPVIRRYSDALIAMRAHNVEHEIWERVAVNSPLLKRCYLQHITPRLKAYETAQLNQYDLMVAISARDLAQFQAMGLQKPGVIAPIGIDCRGYQPDRSSFTRPLSLSFIGSLDWMPNLEGLRWFLDQVWKPLLSRRFPSLELHIAGRNTPAWLTNLRLPGVQVHGEVPSAPDFINRHSAMVVPLLSGGGMRAKALEGMALGKVVLSTAMGMEGIDAVDKEHCLVADTPEAFAQAIAWCAQQGPQLESLGARARALCEQRYDNIAIAHTLADTYRLQLNRQHALVS